MFFGNTRCSAPPELKSFRPSGTEDQNNQTLSGYLLHEL